MEKNQKNQKNQEKKSKNQKIKKIKKKNQKIKKIKEKIKKIKNQKNLVRFFSSASPEVDYKVRRTMSIKSKQQKGQYYGRREMKRALSR